MVDRTATHHKISDEVSVVNYLATRVSAPVNAFSKSLLLSIPHQGSLAAIHDLFGCLGIAKVSHFCLAFVLGSTERFSIALTRIPLAATD